MHLCRPATSRRPTTRPTCTQPHSPQVRKWRTAITGARLLVKWAAYSTPFLLTGELPVSVYLFRNIL